MIEIVLATTNVHKIRELKALLSHIPHLEVLTLRAFAEYTPPEEEGDTFYANAVAKAVHAAQELNRYVLADDSGLIVPVLDNKPGVHSARYAGPEATDQDNRKKLLEKMEKYEGAHRAAAMHCCLAFASPEGLIAAEEGVCEGEILSQPKGGNGFGYDCLFRKHDYNQTFAELDEATKNRISHRAKAFGRLEHRLETTVTKAFELLFH